MAAEGVALVAEGVRRTPTTPDPYVVQAAIAGCHALAQLHAVHARAQLAHRAGAFQPHHVGQRGLVLVAAMRHQQVGEVDAGGADADQHLARTGGRRRDLADMGSGVEFAQFLDDQRAHGEFSLGWPESGAITLGESSRFSLPAWGGCSRRERVGQR